ncbi:hypothetical protein P7K49_025772 [Saguinus oedipus]|uniref:Uncharacterized protein n=1 Tax=Saguinus oedipus TaxID=9490 RepID=A0ABQ9UI37_SAGOE|nr:hypothetical protein P7K49_025772 [Saguinus oedipus]
MLVYVLNVCFTYTPCISGAKLHRAVNRTAGLPTPETVCKGVLNHKCRKVGKAILAIIYLTLPYRGLFLNLLSPFSLQLERSFKFMREAEDQLKAIPQFCFPDAKDWVPVQQFTRYELASPVPNPKD